jgi:hypothetical protein
VADPQNSAGQIVADPAQGLPHSNENDLSYANSGTVVGRDDSCPIGNEADLPGGTARDPCGNRPL